MMSKSSNPIIRPAGPAPAPEVEDLFGDDDGAFPPEAYVGRLPNSWPHDEPDLWEELTEVDGRFLLRHANKVYAAVEVPADSIIAQAFKPPEPTEPVKRYGK